MRGFAEFTFNRSDLQAFEARCAVAIRNVERGTKKATTEAAETILSESKLQVPLETSTLLRSAYYEVKRRTDTSKNTWAYEAEIGYGGNGDPINPVTGMPASSYMVAVHEDLEAEHPTGKAKFLEDPVRDYSGRFERTIFKHARESLADMSD